MKLSANAPPNGDKVSVSADQTSSSQERAQLQAYSEAQKDTPSETKLALIIYHRLFAVNAAYREAGGAQAVSNKPKGKRFFKKILDKQLLLKVQDEMRERWKMRGDLS